MMWVCLPIKRHTDRIAGLGALETFTTQSMYFVLWEFNSVLHNSYSRFVSPLVYSLFHRTFICTQDLAIANFVHCTNVTSSWRARHKKIKQSIFTMSLKLIMRRWGRITLMTRGRE